MKVYLTPHLKKPNFIKSSLAGFHWKLWFRLWYNFLRKGKDTVVLPITALSARLPEKLFFCLMARFKPGTFSVHFFLFLSHILLFSFETCLSYWLFPNAFLLAASQAWLLFSFCLFLLLLLPCWAAADVRIPPHKSNQSLTLSTLHTQLKDACEYQQPGTVSSQEQNLHSLARL